MILDQTNNIHIYGCSIFRIITSDELENINNILKDKFNLQLEVVSQEDEAKYTALGCYNNIDYNGNLCVFIGGGGSIELIFVNNKKVVDKKYYDFVEELIGVLDSKADILILAGGDHLYWYNNAKYILIKNNLYENEKQKYMLMKEMIDKYDRDALVISLDRIRNNSDNPLWFDGSRVMKVITNLILHYYYYYY